MTIFRTTDIPETLYTPDGKEWKRDRDDVHEVSFYYPCTLERLCLAELLKDYREVSTEPYPPLFKVGDVLKTIKWARTLPEGSIVIDREGNAVKRYFDDEWTMTGHDGLTPTRDIEFPVTVIWLPEN